MYTNCKAKAPYTKKIKIHPPSGRCVYRMLACEDVLDSMKIYPGKHCVEKFIEYIEDEVKQLYAIFP